MLSMPVFSMSRTEFCEFAKQNKLSLICTDMKGQNIFDFKPKQSVGVVIGNEGQGVSDQIRALCKTSVTIPMKSGIESLNAAVSGSIIMFELTKKLK